MTVLTASEARQRLFRLLDEVADSHVPVTIAGPRHSAVLISEEDWRSIQETLYLMSIPGMAESLKEGRATPPEEMDEALSW